MIEQVLYRRTVEQGYNEYCSRGLSKEEAHRVNLVMDTAASDIDDLGSGADSPFMLYPFETMHRFCLAVFQREFSKGRSNSVNHGLLIEDTEYKELVKNPEQIWGFTSKNFLSRKVNYREEMFALKALDSSDNAELSKDSIFREYGLNNNGYLKFLNAIYTSLSKNSNYSCGLRIDNSKDANNVMRHMGYLIMSMLPYELRNKISFCSRSVPDSIGVTVQILQEKDPEKTDITYDMNVGECLVNKPSVEIMNFYLNDLLSMSDAELRDYFSILAAFKDDLELSEDSESVYVVSKLLKLSQKPSIFASETAETQFAFINDVFSLPKSNTDVIHSIVVRLLPFVDSNHYMEAFDINFRLYRKLNSENEFDRQSMTRVEENLIQNYNNATAEEKKQLFTLVFESEEVHIRVCTLLEKILREEDEPFYKIVFNTLVNLFIKSQSLQLKERCYTCISDVIHKEDDEYRLKILQEYNDMDEVEDSLWLETYDAIEDYQSAAANVEFLKCLKDKYFRSSNPEICDLYLEYISYVPVFELEIIIRQYGKQTKSNDREERLLNKVIYVLIRDKKKLCNTALKVLAAAVKDEGVDELASYISTVYLSASSDSSTEVYEFLEAEQPQLFNNAYLNKENLPSFDRYWAVKLDKRVLKDDNNLVNILRYLETLQYHEESFAKIHLTYQKWIDQKIAKTETDYERYLKCKELCNRMNSLLPTQFGNQYCSKLRSQVQNGFWNASNMNTFDYEHCDIYKSNSIIYDQQFREHENHVLAESVSGLIEDSYVDWDKVYEILLSKKYISQDAIRNQIMKDFIKEYHDYGMSVSDLNYIAFISVNKNSLRMDYSKLFDILQKYNYRIDDSAIRRMKIFGYIKVSDQLRKKISEYKNYQSDTPSYGKVIRGLFIEQFAVLFLLYANNISRAFAIKMSENLKIRKLLLLCNYAGYILLIVVVAVVSVLLMKRANMRRSPKYDRYIYGLLIINMLFSAAAIILSAKFTNMISCSLATIVFMVIVIILNIIVMNTIGSHKKGNKMRRWYL